jgi:hypothetical protein
LEQAPTHQSTHVCLLQVLLLRLLVLGLLQRASLAAELELQLLQVTARHLHQQLLQLLLCGVLAPADAPTQSASTADRQVTDRGRQRSTMTSAKSRVTRHACKAVIADGLQCAADIWWNEHDIDNKNEACCTP